MREFLGERENWTWGWSRMQGFRMTGKINGGIFLGKILRTRGRFMKGVLQKREVRVDKERCFGGYYTYGRG